MTRGTLRTMLRRLLQEPAADQWDDASLNEYLNQALIFVEKSVLEVEAEAFVYVDTANLVAGQAMYAKPAGFWYELEVGMVPTPTSSVALPIDLRDFAVIRERYRATGVASTSYPQVYAHVGRYFYLDPPPAVAIPNGLIVFYVPTLTMAADADTPQVHTALHPAIAFWAKMLALDETGEPTEAVQKQLSAILADIPLYYRRSVKPTQILIDADKGY